MARRLFILILSIASFLAWLSVPALAGATSITVSAAISLKDAFQEIDRLYEARDGVRVFYNFGASGDLARQIEAGAPVDVFASAAQKDMNSLEAKGLFFKDTRSDFAANAVVLIVPSGSKGPPPSFEGLAAGWIRRIAVGNPETVPAGRYAEEVLGYYKLLPSVRDRLIFTANVRQVLDYVARGEVDAGIVYATDASIRPKEVKIAAYAPKVSHRPVVYPIAVMKNARNEAAARAFVSLVLSPEGQRILAKYGFKKP